MPVLTPDVITTPDAITVTSHVATSLSLVLAAATYMYNVYRDRKKKTEKTIQNWQRVAIYKAISDGNAKNGKPISFEDLQNAYVFNALTFKDTDIPKDKIQDNALRLALMSLLESKLIELQEDGKYRLVFSSSWKRRKNELLLIKLEQERLREKIKLILHKTPKLDKAELWSQLHESKTTHKNYLCALRIMMMCGEIINKGGLLSLSDTYSK
jgi:hypothetical protein